MSEGDVKKYVEETLDTTLTNYISKLQAPTMIE